MDPEEGQVAGGENVKIEFKEDLPYSDMTVTLDGTYAEAEFQPPRTLLLKTPKSPDIKGVKVNKVGKVNIEIEFYHRRIPLDKQYEYV